MILLFHIVLALTSLLYATYVLLMPARSKIFISFGLITGTLATGTYLVVSTHSSMLHACLGGLLYLSITLSLTIAGQRLLTHSKTDS